MASRISASLSAALFFCIVYSAVLTSGDMVSRNPKKYKYLFFLFESAGSHYMHMRQTGKALVRKGHEVTFLSSRSQSTLPRRNESQSDPFTFMTFQSRHTESNRAEKWRDIFRMALNGEMGESLLDQAYVIIRGVWNKQTFITNIMLDECDDLLGNLAFIDTLRKKKFDMVIGDDFWKCFVILAHTLDVPFVISSNLRKTTAEEFYLYGPLAKPSLTAHNEMTFVERVSIVMSYFLNVFREWLYLRDYDKLKQKYNIKPEMGMHDALKEARLILYNGNLPFEVPRQRQPNVVFAPIEVEIAKLSVAADVTEFLDSAPSGVVLFSLGSYAQFMEDNQAQVFADGFKSLPHRVLWQTRVDVSNVTIGSNTKIVKWVPLAQIMNHTNSEVFIGHGGVNTMLEAMYAGIPVIGFPLYGDQFENVGRLTSLGMGVSLNIRELTSTSLSTAVCQVIGDTSYKEKAKRASSILRGLTAINPPGETAARMIVHVTEFGGDHLHPTVLDLSFIQMNLLDVYLFLASMIVVIVCFNIWSFYQCLNILRRCFGKTDKSKSD